jgi:hypothetical protein
MYLVTTSYVPTTHCRFKLTYIWATVWNYYNYFYFMAFFIQSDEVIKSQLCVKSYSLTPWQELEPMITETNVFQGMSKIALHCFLSY